MRWQQCRLRRTRQLQCLIPRTANSFRWHEMANYHRNTIAGDQVTSIKKDGKPVTMTFASLKDDLAAIQKSVPQGLAEGAVVGQSEQGADIQALRLSEEP